MKNATSTIKDLARWHQSVKHCKVGYCCYQDDGKSRSDLITLGSNSGVYGWNWTAYLDPQTSTMYVSNYRNVPRYILAK